MGGVGVAAGGVDTATDEGTVSEEDAMPGDETAIDADWLAEEELDEAVFEGVEPVDAVDDEPIEGPLLALLQTFKCVVPQPCETPVILLYKVQDHTITPAVFGKALLSNPTHLPSPAQSWRQA